jgi:hypothetical protein
MVKATFSDGRDDVGLCIGRATRTSWRSEMRLRLIGWPCRMMPAVGARSAPRPLRLLRRQGVLIKPFAVEQWMNAHETTARRNTAETCVDSLRVEELLALTGDGDAVLRRLLETRLTYGHITGSPELRAAIAAL